jgi:four helix bundle protein
MALEGLNRLQVYQASQELAQVVYREVITNLPSDEKWGLSSQMRRAAGSVPANIAEGYGRHYYQETIRFCYMARGSLMELSSHFDLAHSQGYISDKTCQYLEEMMDSILKLIHGYIKYLRLSKHGMNEPGNQSISEYCLEYSVGNQDAVDVES